MESGHAGESLLVEALRLAEESISLRSVPSRECYINRGHGRHVAYVDEREVWWTRIHDHNNKYFQRVSFLSIARVGKG